MRIEPSFLFDLGGTLVDSVYQLFLLALGLAYSSQDRHERGPIYQSAVARDCG